MAKSKALLILTPGFPCNEADTACIPPQQIFAKALQQVSSGITVIVLTLTYPFFSATYQWNGIQVMAFGSKRKGRIFRVESAMKIWLALRSLNSEYEIIGLLSFWLGKCAYIGNAFSVRNNLKHYVWLLGQDAKAGNKYFAKIKPLPGTLIALSDFIAREVQKNYGLSPAHTIPVGIDTSLFNPASGTRDVDVLGVGSLLPLKQFPIFLEAVEYCKQHGFQNIRAAICGDGSEMQTLRALINTMNLTENVRLYGELPHADVLAMMQRSKLLLHTSVYEGFGAVCLEALYAGAQVLSFVKPMDADIGNWHIAQSKTEMFEQLLTMVRNTRAGNQPILKYDIRDNAKAMLRLF